MVGSKYRQWGEEAGAIGRVGKWWGDYKDAVIRNTGHYKQAKMVFGRHYGYSARCSAGCMDGGNVLLVRGQPLVYPYHGGLASKLHNLSGQKFISGSHKQGQVMGLC